jgi:hypothetical protein
MHFVLLSQNDDVLVGLHPNQMPFPFSSQEFKSILEKSAVFDESIDIKLFFKFCLCLKVKVLFVPSCTRFVALS